MRAMDVTLRLITAPDLYAVFMELRISPLSAFEEEAMLPVTTVSEPATTEIKQRAAPPMKTAAWRCPTNTKSTAPISTITKIRGRYCIDQNSLFLLFNYAYVPAEASSLTMRLLSHDSSESAARIPSRAQIRVTIYNMYDSPDAYSLLVEERYEQQRNDYIYNCADCCDP